MALLAMRFPAPGTPGEEVTFGELGRIAAGSGDEVGQLVDVLATGLRARVPPGNFETGSSTQGGGSGAGPPLARQTFCILILRTISY